MNSAPIPQRILPESQPAGSVGPANEVAVKRLTSVPHSRPSVIDAAKHYFLCGYTPIPIKPGSKSPFEKDWATKPRSKETVAKDFSDQGNIGLQLGARSRGLTDVDLDCPEAIRLATSFLPSTPLVFGRHSARGSHRLYIVGDAPNKQRETWVWPGASDSNGDRKPTIIEMRIGGNDTEKPKGAQTVVPPRVHQKTGELIGWENDIEGTDPAKVPYADLREACNRIAIAAVILHAYSGQVSTGGGTTGIVGRHDFWLVMGGCLARHGWTEADIATFVEAVCKEAGDEEIDDRIKAADSAVSKYQKGEPVAGLATLSGILGSEAASAIDEWLGPSGGGAAVRPEVVAQLSRTNEYNALEDVPAIDFYYPDELLPALVARFTFIDRGGEVLAVHWDRWGKRTVRDRRGVREYLANIKVLIEANSKIKIVPAADWFWQHKDRGLIHREVFKPNGLLKERETNLWTGYGVKPQPGNDKIKRFMRHLLEMVCAGNKAKFTYLIRWMAWKIQNPEKAPGTIIILRSDKEGAGKSIVSDTMRRLFGNVHSMVVSKPEEIVGDFNDDMDLICFVQLEEALFAGDPRTASRMRHEITGERLRINPKGRKAYEAPNRMGAILTANHTFAWPAGKRDRRAFILDVKEDHADDAAWFDPIYDGLRGGGYEQLLQVLLNLNLESWHPRILLRTHELNEQQRMNADPVNTWLAACAEAGDVVGSRDRLDPRVMPLDAPYHTMPLFDRFSEWTRCHNGTRHLSNKPYLGRSCVRRWARIGTNTILR
jgi:hypothetical protein